jgi:feruloyl esterase
LDATSFLNDSYAAELWGSQSVPMVMSAALAVVKSAYGQDPTKSYFEGGSNGGREGMMAMRRNPNLFDGVIVRSPAYNIVGFFGHWNLNNKALSAPGATLSNVKLATIAKAVRDKCDALDGIADGIVSNQPACNAAFDPATLRCAGGADTGDSCLSDAQLAAVRTVMAPASFGSGQTTYTDAGRPLTGNEDDAGAWPAWISGNGNVRTTISFLLTDSAIKSLIARDLSVDSLTYTPYDQDINSLFALSMLSDATSPDIRAFVNRGGKVIYWHGGNDAAFPVQSTANYVQDVVTTLGGKANADNSVRFYTAAGVNHTSGGPGADISNLLGALDEWVVANKAPGTLLASKLDSAGAVQFERPLCQYPQYPCAASGEP